MLEKRVSPNNYTFALLIKSCIKLTSSCSKYVVESKNIGKMVHGQILKHGVEDFLVIKNSLMNMYCGMDCLIEARLLFDNSLCLDLISWNCMITAYGRCGEVEAARDLFEKMPERNVVTWGAMIDGYVMNSEFSEAIRLFDDMQVSGLKPDATTLVSVLKASGNLGALDQGKHIHLYINENKLGWERNVILGTALVDMYAKCGCIEVALDLFGGIHHKDVILWNVMISGLALHGHGRDALELFFEMWRHGTLPNLTTFVTVLSACAHSGMVEKGIGIFESMKEYGMEPGIEHYGCLADILGRAGRVHEAEQILSSMPMEPQASHWGALMAACRTHNNIIVGERVGKHLISMEPHDGGRYILLSNMYAAIGRWEDARDIRREMDRKGAKKETGCSSIEKDGNIQEFIVGDTTHPCSREIYEMLDDLEREMKMPGTAQDYSSFNNLDSSYSCKSTLYAKNARLSHE
ncbi:Pentatricopeptide repeat-containing protein [Thalictrum thalictroides]|uniref:Pentatricopeptide repeat-containing protein n=1 Tax=Thalictrum thalictroides TaxID=46969 RepID=A0A7J6V339_THATH|nr:Pentatricopeptide repeat-containing protein [Thalictrum thalictroides]